VRRFVDSHGYFLKNAKADALALKVITGYNNNPDQSLSDTLEIKKVMGNILEIANDTNKTGADTNVSHTHTHTQTHKHISTNLSTHAHTHSHT
jgi:intein-encoded DNA endonuclease-like protein